MSQVIIIFWGCAIYAACFFNAFCKAANGARIAKSAKILTQFKFTACNDRNAVVQ